MEPYDELKTHHNLFIRAPMGHGKTQHLMTYLKGKYFLYVSFRVSLAKDISLRLSQAKICHMLYQTGVPTCFCNTQHKGNMPIIVQFESLCKYIGTFIKDGHRLDAIVYDETVSIVQHLPSQIQQGSKAMNISLLKDLTSKAKKMICLDASMSQYYAEYMLKLRPKTKSICYDLQFLSQAMHKRTISYYMILQDMIEAIQQDNADGKRLAIYCNSVKLAETLAKTLGLQGNTLLLTGNNYVSYDDMPNVMVKDEVTNDIDSYLIDNDIKTLIYTSTLQAGVSITKTDIAHTYCFCHINVNSSEANFQASSRARQGDISICLYQNRKEYKKVSYVKEN